MRKTNENSTQPETFSIRKQEMFKMMLINSVNLLNWLKVNFQVLALDENTFARS